MHAKLALLVGCTTLLLSGIATPAHADVMTVTLTESQTQPILLTFTARPGTVLLCDTTGFNSSTPRDKNGVWGCYSGVGVTEKLVEASDLITFAANPNPANNAQFPSMATVCSELDTAPDPGDGAAVCRLVGLTVTANFALQELGVERRGPEETPYSPTNTQPGYSQFMEGTRTVTVAYNLVSDPATRAPEPGTAWLMLGAILAGTMLAHSRRSAVRMGMVKDALQQEP